MKHILLLLLFAATLTTTSCNKCYECKTSTDTKQYCKESAEYTVIKNGGTITDNNGQNYVCTLK